MERETTQKTNYRWLIWVGLAVVALFLFYKLGFFDSIFNSTNTTTGTELAGYDPSNVPTTVTDVPVSEFTPVDNSQVVDVTGLSAQERAELALQLYGINMAAWTTLMSPIVSGVINAPVDCQNAANLYTERQQKECINYASQCVSRNFWGNQCKDQILVCKDWGNTVATLTQAEIVYSDCATRRATLFSSMEYNRPTLEMTLVSEGSISNKTISSPADLLSTPSSVTVDQEIVDTILADNVLKAQLGQIEAMYTSISTTLAIPAKAHEIAAANELISGSGESEFVVAVQVLDSNFADAPVTVDTLASDANDYHLGKFFLLRVRRPNVVRSEGGGAFYDLAGAAAHSMRLRVPSSNLGSFLAANATSSGTRFKSFVKFDDAHLPNGSAVVNLAVAAKSAAIKQSAPSGNATAASYCVSAPSVGNQTDSSLVEFLRRPVSFKTKTYVGPPANQAMGQPYMLCHEDPAFAFDPFCWDFDLTQSYARRYKPKMKVLGIGLPYNELINLVSSEVAAGQPYVAGTENTILVEGSFATLDALNAFLGTASGFTKTLAQNKENQTYLS